MVTTAKRFSIYQTLGGGVAILDYDLDGWPDLYFAQGGADPPGFQSEFANPLYRNLADRLIEVTNNVTESVDRYSLGVTAGDWNQDGFPDLAVANIGNAVLLTNQGDGTFKATTLDGLQSDVYVSSSIAIADLTNDDLPEILHLTNRVYVMYRGELRAKFQGDAITEEAVLGEFFEKEAA